MLISGDYSKGQVFPGQTQQHYEVDIWKAIYGFTFSGSTVLLSKWKIIAALCIIATLVCKSSQNPMQRSKSCTGK